MTQRAIGMRAISGRTFLTAVLVASSGVTFGAMSVWARNFAAILSPLRLVQLILVEVIVCAVVLALAASSSWNLTATALTLSLGGLLFSSGEAISQRLGQPASLLSFFLGISALAILTFRLAASNERVLGTLAVFISLFFLLQPPLTMFLEQDVGQGSSFGAAIPSVRNTGAAEDFFLVVLDGYASFSTLRDEFLWNSSVPDMLGQRGFETVDAAWSPSTWSLVAIPSLLSLEVPLTDGSGLEKADVAGLFDTISGNARLFSMFGSAGYEFTYIESGWSGSVCGEVIDTCRRRPFVDEAVQAVVESSLVSDLVHRYWGHSFSRAGLHSLSEVERAVSDLGANGKSDLVFAHVMLPHEPYMLGPECQMMGASSVDPFDERSEGLDLATLKAAYLAQVGCVDRWLDRITAHIPRETAAVITGDHGSLFRGQMLRDPSTWSPADIAERSQTFLAFKLPASCRPGSPVSSSLQALMDASDCLLGTRLDRSLTEKVWLLGRGPTPRCIKQPQADMAISDVPC